MIQTPKQYFPKNSFELYEQICFLYKYKDNPAYKKQIEIMKSSIGNQRERLERIVLDIVILLEGNSSNSEYIDSFLKYKKNYSDFKTTDLFDYCRFICKTFDINLPESKVVIEPRKYVPSLKMEEIIARSNVK